MQLLWLETISHGNQAVLILMVTAQLLICEIMGLNKQELAKMHTVANCNVEQMLKMFLCV